MRNKLESLRMEENQTLEFLIETVRLFHQNTSEESNMGVSAETVLFGESSQFDSLGLVTLLTELETKLTASKRRANLINAVMDPNSLHHFADLAALARFIDGKS